MGSTFLDQWSDDVAPEIREQVPLFEWNLAEPLSDESRQAGASICARLHLPSGRHQCAAAVRFVRAESSWRMRSMWVGRAPSSNWLSRWPHLHACW